ncbi:redoxin domain-containing protein [bacterium]|nr:redoxin domain-containing protein [bacterium]
MRLYFSIMIFVGMLLTLIALQSQADNSLNMELTSIGCEVLDQAPDFSLPDESETIITLSDYRGKNIVFIFHVGST